MEEYIKLIGLMLLCTIGIIVTFIPKKKKPKLKEFSVSFTEQKDGHYIAHVLTDNKKIQKLISADVHNILYKLNYESEKESEDKNQQKINFEGRCEMHEA